MDDGVSAFITNRTDRAQEVRVRVQYGDDGTANHFVIEPVPPARRGWRDLAGAAIVLALAGAAIVLALAGLYVWLVRRGYRRGQG